MLEADLSVLCDPIGHQPLKVNGDALIGSSTYAIRNGIQRFGGNTRAVESLGEEWNEFNYDDFRTNWLEHCITPTFGGLSVFKDKVIVDAGAGSGMHSRWMVEAGARKVYALELCHSVDGVMQKNLGGLGNVSSTRSRSSALRARCSSWYGRAASWSSTATDSAKVRRTESDA